MTSTIKFIDTNIFIERWSNKKAETYLETLDPDKDATSILVLSELYHKLQKKGFDGFKMIRKIMGMITVYEVTQDDFFRAMRNPVGVQINDKLHIEVMKRNGIDTILSYDKGFDKDKTIKRVEL